MLKVAFFPLLSDFGDKKDLRKTELWEPHLYLPIKGDARIVW